MPKPDHPRRADRVPGPADAHLLARFGRAAPGGVRLQRHGRGGRTRRADRHCPRPYSGRRRCKPALSRGDAPTLKRVCVLAEAMNCARIPCYFRECIRRAVVTGIQLASSWVHLARRVARPARDCPSSHIRSPCTDSAVLDGSGRSGGQSGGAVFGTGMIYHSADTL